MSFQFTEPTSTHPDAAPAEEKTPDVIETSNVTPSEPDVVPPVGDDNVPAGDPSGEEPKAAPEEEGAPTEPKPDDPEGVDSPLYFGEFEVEIDIPQDVTDGLAEKGIDAKAVAAELYRDGGDFSLSDETKQKLYDAFGKFAVDAYLGGLKAQNDSFIHQMGVDEAAAEQANVERYNAVAAEVGGDDGWNRLEEYALGTLSDQDLAAFNAVMASGNQYLQQYAIRELESRRKQAQGDDSVRLVDATSTASSSTENGPMSAHQYISAIANLGKQYGNDRVARAEAERELDARRTAGMKAGL